MYLMLLEFIKKPSNIIITILIGLLMFCFINGQVKSIKIDKLEVKIESLQQDLDGSENTRKIEKDLYEHNLEVVKQAFNELQGEVENLKNVIKQKNEELVNQGDRVEYWKKMYANKPCVNNDQEIVKPSKGIINDEANIKVVNTINNLFNF